MQPLRKVRFSKETKYFSTLAPVCSTLPKSINLTELYIAILDLGLYLLLPLLVLAYNSESLELGRQLIYLFGYLYHFVIFADRGNFLDWAELGEPFAELKFIGAIFDI